MKRWAGHVITVAAASFLSFLLSSPVGADPLNCNLSGYRGVPGLTATLADNTLTVAWDGDTGQAVRLRFAIDAGAPIIRELAVRLKSGQWSTLGTNLTPEYRIVAGFRRITNQQLTPLRALRVEITPAVVDQYKWDAFWDAPLYIDAAAVPAAGRGAPAGGRGAPASGRGHA